MSLKIVQNFVEQQRLNKTSTTSSQGHQNTTDTYTVLDFLNVYDTVVVIQTSF